MLLGYSEAAIADAETAYNDFAVDDPLADDSAGEPAASGISIWVTLGGLLVASLGVAAFVLLRVQRL